MPKVAFSVIFPFFAPYGQKSLSCAQIVFQICDFVKFLVDRTIIKFQDTDNCLSASLVAQKIALKNQDIHLYYIKCV